MSPKLGREDGRQPLAELVDLLLRDAALCVEAVVMAVGVVVVVMLIVAGVVVVMVVAIVVMITTSSSSTTTVLRPARVHRFGHQSRQKVDRRVDFLVHSISSSCYVLSLK